MQWVTGLKFGKAIYQTWCKLLTSLGNLFHFDTLLYLVPAASSLLSHSCDNENSSSVEFVFDVWGHSLSGLMRTYATEPSRDFTFLGRYS